LRKIWKKQPKAVINKTLWSWWWSLWRAPQFSSRLSYWMSSGSRLMCSTRC